ncbi:MAG: flagellar assembly protein FliW [Fibrobacterota bacterium]|nr:flagellar assembly protein FliW [Fibrobacterota bacterium]QQS04705.1 MAG: flagellar assembly protein FliW [Fibrobacterota bacterium]
MEHRIEQLNYQREDVITFAQGMPGFEATKEYVIFTKPEHEPFHWMASVVGPPVQFVLINPLIFRPDYDPVIASSEIRGLDVQDPKELLLYSIVTVQPDMRLSTANLAGPLFINIRTRLGKQILVDDPRWTTSVGILS